MDLYTLDAVIWSLGGFVAGFLAEKVWDYWNCRHAKHSDEAAETRSERILVRQIIATLLLGLALLSIFVSWRNVEIQAAKSDRQVRFAHRAQAIALCQAKFNEKVIQTLQEQEKVAQKRRHQIVRVFQDVITVFDQGNAQVPALREELQAYIDSVRKYDRQHHLETPPPPSPSCVDAGKE